MSAVPSSSIGRKRPSLAGRAAAWGAGIVVAAGLGFGTYALYRQSAALDTTPAVQAASPTALAQGGVKAPPGGATGVHNTPATPQARTPSAGAQPATAAAAHGTVLVEPGPSGAPVRVERDGRDLGAAPVRLELPAGVEEVALRAGADVDYRYVDVARDATTTLAAP